MSKQVNKQVKNKTINGIIFTTENTSSAKSSAIMKEVNRVMGLYAAFLPANYRRSVMSVLYKAIREGGLRVANVTSASGPNKGVQKTRHLLKAGTTFTPYTSTTDVGDGRKNVKDRTYNTGGVNMQYFLEGLCELFVNNNVNPITGVTETQLETLTKKSFRNYKINTSSDTVKEMF